MYTTRASKVLNKTQEKDFRFIVDALRKCRFSVQWWLKEQTTFSELLGQEER